MPATLILLAALAATQSPPPAVQAVPPAAGHGREFLSPMGEPFHAAGTDGLTVWFQGADRNHDGGLTLDEFRDDGLRFYATLDLNHDGEIDPDELDRYENVIAPEVRGSWGSEGGDDESSGGSRLGVLNIPEPVAAADTNLNRGVSTQEFVVAAEKRFGLLDMNGDGRLTLAELQASRSAVRANARRGRATDSDTGQLSGAPADTGTPQQPQ